MAVEGSTAAQVMAKLNKRTRVPGPTLNPKSAKLVQSRKEDFYEYSMKWQEQRDEHLTRLKSRLAAAKEEDNKTPPRKPPTTPPGYIGPISGWNDHCHAFIDRRTREIQEFPFSPTIDPKSKEMMSSSASFIDRVTHWQDSKLKHAKEKQTQRPAKHRSTSPLVDPVQRGVEMHGQAVKQIQKRAEAAEAVIKSMCPFKPKINPHSSELAALARLKNMTPTPVLQSASESLAETQPEQKLSKASLDKFLERNYSSPLTRSKSPTGAKSPNFECTFSPSILDRSRELTPRGDLYSRSQHFEIKKSAKLDNLRSEHLKREVSDCTFKPSLTKTKNPNSSTTSMSTYAEALNCIYKDTDGAVRVMDVYCYGDLEAMQEVDEVEARL
jgi:hypothetical protein